MWFCCLFGGHSETIFFCDAWSGCYGCDCALHSILEICLLCCQLCGFHGAGFGVDWFSPGTLYGLCAEQPDKDGGWPQSWVSHLLLSWWPQSLNIHMMILAPSRQVLASAVRPPSVSLVVFIPSLFFLSQFMLWGSKGTMTDADSR